LGFLQDIAPVLQKHKLTFLEKRHETGNITSFFFQSEDSITWKAGQHGILSFSRKLKGGSWRGFSIASHPDEAVVHISTRITEKPSAYKQALSELTPGDQISMRGPFGPFYLDGSQKPVVLIAGGIGITPYRSMIMHAALHKDQAPSAMQLLYADNAEQYAYRQEFEEVVSQNDFIKADYLTSLTLASNLSACVRDWGNNAGYYISGSGKMIGSVKKSLIEQRIAKRNIKHDLFLGL